MKVKTAAAQSVNSIRREKLGLTEPISDVLCKFKHETV